MTENKKIAMRVSLITVAANLLLSVFKFLAGILSGSSAMLSDAVHSSSDVISTFIVMIGVQFSEKKADNEHRYGHERFESIASIILAVILALTGIGIGAGGIQKMMKNDADAVVIPGMLALVAAVLSILIKEWMYWYTIKAAKKIRSDALRADAWHHRSDALSSIGAFIGILGARLGFPLLDPLASIVICGFILKAAISIFKDAVDKLVDKSCDDETEQQIKALALNQPGVLGIDEIRTRMFGAKIYVDVEIRANGNLSLTDSHEIAEQVHDRIEQCFPQVKHCMVHVNPADKALAD